MQAEAIGFVNAFVSPVTVEARAALAGWAHAAGGRRGEGEPRTITEGTPTQSLNTRVSSEATAPGPSRANLAGATFEQVVAGRSRLNVMVTDQKQRQETKLPNGGTRYSASVLFETTAEVVIAPSERTRLQL